MCSADLVEGANSNELPYSNFMYLEPLETISVAAAAKVWLCTTFIYQIHS